MCSLKNAAKWSLHWTHLITPSISATLYDIVILSFGGILRDCNNIFFFYDLNVLMHYMYRLEGFSLHDYNDHDCTYVLLNNYVQSRYV